jgi:hypothetical protein
MALEPPPNDEAPRAIPPRDRRVDCAIGRGSEDEGDTQTWGTQRLKKMIIAPIDNRDAYRRPGKPPHSLESA